MGQSDIDGVTFLLVIGAIACFGYVIWSFIDGRRADPSAASKPYDPLEDAKAWDQAARNLNAVPPMRTVGPITGRPLEEPKPMSQPDVTPTQTFYVERVIVRNPVLGWVALLANNLICLFAMMGVQTIWAQILSGVIQLNGNVIILLLMFLRQRSVFVASHGRPPDDAK